MVLGYNFERIYGDADDFLKAKNDKRISILCKYVYGGFLNEVWSRCYEAASNMCVDGCDDVPNYRHPVGAMAAGGLVL